MKQAKKLIEVAMPIKEISAESVRDKSIRHGHISTLHLWWARRPLPVCRAVVFASLVPDPLDPACPSAFQDAVEILLGPKCDLGNVYKPYEDIPHTAVVDKMEDNLRNRLLMFIGKFSDKYVSNEKQGKNTPAKNQLHRYSLIKWDNKNEESVIGRARKLIFVSHNAHSGKDAQHLIAQHDQLWSELKEAERRLYHYPDRHESNPEVEALEKAKDAALEAFLAKMPKVFDPFAGGGAIPLEAARLGCNSYGNDINPVAHIIQRGSCEFPQRFGKPITYSLDNFVKQYGEKTLKQCSGEGQVFGDTLQLPNRLAFDVEYYALQLLDRVEKEIGNLYPKDEKGNQPIAYYWARIGKCENPSCGAQVPLLRGFYLVNKGEKKIFLNPQIDGNKISFSIEEGKCNLDTWMYRANLTCPCCGNITTVNDLKKQFRIEKPKTKLLAVIEDSSSGKKYRLPTKEESSLSESVNVDRAGFHETMDNGNYRDLKLPKWGFHLWSDMFTNRQLLALQTFVEQLQALKTEWGTDLSTYQQAVITYLAIWIDRIAIKQVSFITWDSSRETVSNLFGRQAIPMKFDFVESVTFCNSSGSARNQIDWIIRFIRSESTCIPSVMKNTASGERNQFAEDELDAVVTDPPYYDAIAYADLSDFFYIWLKRTVFDLYPFNFATPQTPKTEECTALKHHHENNTDKAFQHFDKKLLQIFDAIEHQTNGIVSIMFAHQSTDAWTTLCNSILGARMNITGSWASDTELQNRMVGLSGDALASSVTVACKPSQKSGIGDYKVVRKEILQVIKEEVAQLYALGFRGADLLTACFGKAVSVFGQYQMVEKADGTQVTVAELLEMAREAAFNAIVSDINTDDLTKFYIGWLNLFGFSEAVHDDVRRILQIGLSVDISDIYRQHILVKNKDKGFLGHMQARIAADSKLGLRPVKNNHIDIAQRLMYLYDPQNASRKELLDYIADKAPTAEAPVWRVLNSLVELLPNSSKIKDQELAAGLLANQDNLLKAAKNRQEEQGIQTRLELE